MSRRIGRVKGRSARHGHAVRKQNASPLFTLGVYVAEGVGEDGKSFWLFRCLNEQRRKELQGTVRRRLPACGRIPTTVASRLVGMGVAIAVTEVEFTAMQIDD